MISYKVYGTEIYADKLIEANPEHLKTVIFDAGIKLRIPDIEIPSPETLPPWKR
nr:hypothetical protein [Tepidanaerobacter syntrophicus]